MTIVVKVCGREIYWNNMTLCEGKFLKKKQKTNDTGLTQCLYGNKHRKCVTETES